MNKALRWRHAALLLAAAATFAVSRGATAQATPYQFIDLGIGFASGINNSGQVVGASTVDGRDLATLWTGAVPTYLATPAGSSSTALGINDMGQVVGYINTVAPHATLWKGTTTPIDLHPANGPTYDPTYSIAAGINNAGQVVGHGRFIRGGTVNAALWNGADRTDLPALADNAYEGYATAINDAGTVVGYGSGPSSAILWNGTTPTDLGALGLPHWGEAFAINSAGQVVGRSLAADDIGHALFEHAVLWDGGTITDLGEPNRSSSANDINDAGQIVGFSDGGANGINPHLAMLWEGTVATDLNSRLDAEIVDAGWILVSATGINESGWIAGSAYNAVTGETHAFLLSAIPEPGSYALLSVGLGVLALALRRRAAREPRACSHYGCPCVATKTAAV